MARKSKTKLDKNAQMAGEANEALADAQNELESFCYAVSHDLRAPLRSIDGFSHVLMHDFGEKLEPQAREYLERIVQGTKKLGRLIDEMLSISRVQRAELYCEKVDLAEIAKELVVRLKEKDPQREVKVVIDGPLFADGDRRLLTVALEKIVENAWKFTSKTASARINICQKSSETERIFLVEDNGVGFDSQNAERLFKPFQRLHPQSEFPGIGAGLALARAIIRRHGGRIWAESAPGQGAVFYFTIGS